MLGGQDLSLTTTNPSRYLSPSAAQQTSRRSPQHSHFRRYIIHTKPRIVQTNLTSTLSVPRPPYLTRELTFNVNNGLESFMRCVCLKSFMLMVSKGCHHDVRKCSIPLRPILTVPKSDASQVHIFGSQTPIRSLRNRSVSFEENREPLSVTDSVIMGVHQSWNVKRESPFKPPQTTTHAKLLKQTTTMAAMMLRHRKLYDQDDQPTIAQIISTFLVPEYFFSLSG